MMRKSAGEFDRRGALQAPQGVNIMGSVLTGWTTVFERWVHRQAMSGREYIQADRVSADVSVQVSCRFDAELAKVARASWRWLIDDSIHEIEAILAPEQNGDDIVFMCKGRTGV